MENYPITISVEVEYEEKFSRLTTFFRYAMAIPHYICLWSIGIAAQIVVSISWWAILFLGRRPRWAFDFVSGYLRWYTRVGGYRLLLADKHPLFGFQ